MNKAFSVFLLVAMGLSNVFPITSPFRMPSQMGQSSETVDTNRLEEPVDLHAAAPQDTPLQEAVLGRSTADKDASTAQAMPSELINTSIPGSAELTETTLMATPPQAPEEPFIAGDPRIEESNLGLPSGDLLSGSSHQDQAAPQSSPVRLVLSVTPDLIVPGSEMILSWEILATDEIKASTDLELLLTAPVGFIPKATDLDFDENTSTLRLPVKQFKDTMQWIAPSDIPDEPIFKAELISGGGILASNELVLNVETIGQVGPDGGEVSSKNGKVKVHFPQGSTTNNLKLKIHEGMLDEQPPYSLSGHPIEIIAEDETTQAVVHVFPNRLALKSLMEIWISKAMRLP